MFRPPPGLEGYGQGQAGPTPPGPEQEAEGLLGSKKPQEGPPKGHEATEAPKP